MTTLGEAFIRVRADMGPFRRDLKNETETAAQEFERILAPAIANTITDAAEKAGKEGGEKAGDGLAEGIKRRTGNKNNDVWVAFIGAFAGALDDGISALPTELKATIVLALLAVSPLIIAGLGGAIAAGIAAGVAGLGVAFGSQFQTVQDRWASFLSTVRSTLTQTAEAFEPVLLAVMNRVEKRFEQLAPRLESIFDKSADFVLPLVDALVDAFDFVLESLDAAMQDSDGFVRELAKGIAILGAAIGEVIAILASTGDDGEKALRDLVFIVADLLIGVAQLVKVFTHFYGLVRDLADATPVWVDVLLPLLGVFDLFTDAADSTANSTEGYNIVLGQLGATKEEIIAKTKAEEKALKALEKQTQDNIDAAFGMITTNIAWERSLDEITESFKENGRTLKFETEEGRRNLESIVDALEKARKRAEQRTKEGVLNAQEMDAAFRKEIQAIYDRAVAEGASRKELEGIFGTLVSILSLPPPNVDWAHSLAGALARAAAESRKIKIPGAYGDFDPSGRPLADGGIVYGPSNHLIGEAGAEAVIPMTRPQRAMQLMRQAGLDRLVSGNNNIAVQVFVGNEELDARTVRIVQQSSNRQSQLLNFGVRS
jgi:hypothetical protein